MVAKAKIPICRWLVPSWAGFSANTDDTPVTLRAEESSSVAMISAKEVVELSILRSAWSDTPRRA